MENRIEEAKNCSDCLSWHKYCNAECCRIVFLNISGEKYRKSGKYVVIDLDKELSINDQYYFKLRDIEYIRGKLRFMKSRVIKQGDDYVYIKKCKLLHDCKCMNHPDRKPEICKSLTLETSQDKNGKFKLTDNCLFKYKCKEVN